MFEPKIRVTALLENRPDLLSRAVSLLHRRSFQVASFALGRTDRPEVARLTVVVEGLEAEGERLARELQRLMYTIRVDASRRPSVDRSIALIKVAAGAESRPEVFQLCEVFRAQVIDVARGSVIVELTGEESKIESFMEVLRPFGIVEMVRNGPVSLGRADHVLDDTDRENQDEATSSWAEHKRRREAPTWN